MKLAPVKKKKICPYFPFLLFWPIAQFNALWALWALFLSTIYHIIICMKINAIAIVLFKNDMIMKIHERDIKIATILVVIL